MEISGGDKAGTVIMKQLPTADRFRLFLAKKLACNTIGTTMTILPLSLSLSLSQFWI